MKADGLHVLNPREDDHTWISSRLGFEVLSAVSAWREKDRHDLRLALENVPHDVSNGDAFTHGAAYAMETAFRSFALSRGLLAEAYFVEHPGCVAPSADYSSVFEEELVRLDNAEVRRHAATVRRFHL